MSSAVARTLDTHSLYMAVSGVQCPVVCYGRLMSWCQHMEWAAISTDGHGKNSLYTLTVYGCVQCPVMCYGRLMFWCQHMEWAAISTDGYGNNSLYTLTV